MFFVFASKLSSSAVTPRQKTITHVWMWREQHCHGSDLLFLYFTAESVVVLCIGRGGGPESGVRVRLTVSLPYQCHRQAQSLTTTSDSLASWLRSSVHSGPGLAVWSFSCVPPGSVGPGNGPWPGLTRKVLVVPSDSLAEALIDSN